MNRFLGNIIFILINILTIVLWFLSKDISQVINNPFQSLSQITGILGIVLISLSLLLTTRFSFIENFFGGLDKIYINHRILGSFAFILLISHPLLLIIDAF